MLIIAHRLTTLRDVDSILVFCEGKVIEDGTYSALLASNGVFADLVRASEAGSGKA